jgi:hypothetical protein
LKSTKNDLKFSAGAAASRSFAVYLKPALPVKGCCLVVNILQL